VALDAMHGQPAGQRAAPADLDRVTERALAGRLANHAPVDLLSAGAQQLDDPSRAVDRRTFLIAGQQEGQRAAVTRVPRDEACRCGHHRREPGLHVGRAAPVQHTVTDDRLEWVGQPLLARPGRDDVRVTGEAQQWRPGAVHRPEVVDWPERQPLVREPGVRQARAEHVQAAVILGADGRPSHQFRRKFDRF
jgi:hypothetical protein